jgi:DNA adenine methylase
MIYVEPYAGGAGAALSLLLLEKVNAIVINDRDPAIYAFWRSILNKTDEFIEMIKVTPLTVEEWEKQKRIYKTADTTNLFALGFATFYLNRTNRSGVLNGGPIGGKNQSGEWKIDARYNKQALINRIKLISLYKDRITVTRSDGIRVIQKYAANPNVFMYIDPPYFIKGGNLYLNAFKLHDHQRLASTLNKFKDAKWVLTYDNEDEIRRLYPDLDQEVFSLKYSVHLNSRLGSEVMIFSDTVKH